MITLSPNLYLAFETRAAGDPDTRYHAAEASCLLLNLSEAETTELKTRYTVSVTNSGKKAYSGILHFSVRCKAADPKFFMPGYMYNRNTADMPSSGRKPFPRIRRGADIMPESEFFMTRADRLSLPLSMIWDAGRVIGISAAPYLKDSGGHFEKYCGFSCSINEDGLQSAGYTLGYENAPWLFVQTATVKDREPITAENAVMLGPGETIRFDLSVYDYAGQDERAVYRAVEDAYRVWHERPRSIPGMTPDKALALLSGAVRDHAWLEEERIYTGFVFDRETGFEYNRIPSVSWTNGLAVSVPMLMAADRLNDEKARAQSLTAIGKIIESSLNPASGFMFESEEDGKPTVRGWWYSGMHSGGHSSYLNGQAVWYILRAYMTEKTARGVEHTDWLGFCGSIVSKMNSVMNTDHEYPFAMSVKTGAGIEYDSLGSAWFLAASALYELVTGDRQYMDLLLKSEAHYYDAFIRKVECYGGPLDTDKAVDSEGVLAYIRAVKHLHELTKEEYLLDHLRDALYYEFTFKLAWNTVIGFRPLSGIGWSSCGGSITSTANPHIHPMSSTVIAEMKYYLSFREDQYTASRLADTAGWSLQTFNTFDKEYGYGKMGWMSERFCFCQGLLTEKYPDGETASTWFALMPWASASIIEGLAAL
ncbi:MAG: hypothetical protein Q4G19_08670 [Clostridia bacterium]|nr:hypothetical protein [Clostridia bacterium]